jgi:hypothetical protein
MKWIPYFKNKGESVMDALKDIKEPPTVYHQFFVQRGDVLLEFVEKIVTERIKQDDFEKMTKVQCAFLGYNALLGLMQQLSVDINALEKAKTLKKK